MTTKKKSTKKKVTAKKKVVAKKKVTAKKKVVAKKKTVAKKKAPKKVIKKTVATSNTKRYFMLEIGGRGSEIIVGSSTKEFVEYWKDRDNELADHMISLVEVSDHEEYSPEDEDFEYPEYYDKDSPKPNGKSIKPYFEYDDIEHETCVNADSDYHSYSVTEIKLDPDVEYSNGEISWKDGITDDDDFDWGREKFEEVAILIREEGTFNTAVYSREMFIENDKSKVDKPVPVIMMCDSQKGTFGHVFVETNGEDFDPSKVVIGVLETNMDDIVYEIFYNKQSLSMDTDFLSTSGSGFYATVGYMEKDYLKFNRKAWIKEGFKELGL